MLSVYSPWQRTRHFQHSHPEWNPSTHPIQANSPPWDPFLPCKRMQHGCLELYSPPHWLVLFPTGLPAGPRHLQSSKVPILTQRQRLCTLFLLSRIISSAGSVSCKTPMNPSRSTWKGPSEYVRTSWAYTRLPSSKNTVAIKVPRKPPTPASQ